MKECLFFGRSTRREFFTETGSAFGGIIVESLSPMEKPNVVYSLPRKGYDPLDIAITVDDCWLADPLEGIISVVKEKKVPLTIFPVGRMLMEEKIRKHLLLAAELGCCFGNHTYNHKILTNLKAEELGTEISSGYDILQKYIPSRQILPILRPPCGIYNSNIIDFSAKLGNVKSIIMWNCTSGGTGYQGDFAGEAMKRSLEDQIKVKGSRGIVLTHGIPIDTRVFGWFVDFLRDSGYNLVDLRNLVESPRVTPFIPLLSFELRFLLKN